MRTAILAVAALLAMTLAAGVAAAQAGLAEDFTRGPGIAPDSPYYGLDVAYEDARVRAAPGAAERARLHLDFSEERGAEIRRMAERGKPAFAANATWRYSEHVNASLRIAGNVSGDAERQRLREHVANATSRHYFVLQRVRGEVPEQARPGLDRALNASLNGRMRAVNAVARDHPAAAARHHVAFADRLMMHANETTDPELLRQHLRIHQDEMNRTMRLINRTHDTGLQVHVYNRTAAHLRIMDHIRTRAPTGLRAPVEDAMRATNRTRAMALGHVEDHDPALADRMQNRTHMPDDMPPMHGMGRR